MASTNQEILDRIGDETVASAFLRTAADRSAEVAVRGKVGESWEEMRFGDLLEAVSRVAGGLQSMGVGHGDRVVLMMRNIPEFSVVDLAVVFCGATPVSIYNSSAPEQVQYLTAHSKAKVAIVEDSGFLSRFEEVREQLPDLERVVVIHDEGVTGDWVSSYSELAVAEPIDLAQAAAAISPDDLATIIYTSGTTGNPKGVMITHRNVAWTSASLNEAFGQDVTGFRIVSYLPMAHIAERMTSHYGMVFHGFEVSTCPDPTQVATCAKEVHPQFMFGVPRVWEKIHSGVKAFLSLDPEKAQKFDEGVEAAIPIAERIALGTATDEDMGMYAFLDEVAFKQVRAAIGLDELILGFSGAAPIPADIIRWYRAIGVPLCEVYGMSENTGPLSSSPLRPKAGTVGQAIPGCELRLAEDGEVIARGGHVFPGYLDDPEKTAEALDADGWLHTGDIGEFDDEGYLRIVDRKKELIITAGGKNVSPANLEAALKTIPLVCQACAIGDGRPFVSALVTLDPEVAPVWAAQHGIEFSGLADLANNPEVVAAINEGLEQAMDRFNNAERVKKVTILGEEWLPDSEVLTPTSKLKRRGVNSRYAKEIEALYS